MTKKETKEEGSVYAEIPLSLIDTEGQTVRELKDDDHVIELAMSISKHGLLEPIVVQENNGRYQLLAGLHRLAAFHRLRKKIIPAHIKKEYTGPVKGIALVENICRLNMSLQEEVEAVLYLGEVEKLSVSQIQDMTGKSRDWVIKRVMSNNLPEDTKQYLFEGSISLGHAEILGTIEEESSRKYITSVIIQQKLSVTQAHELCRLYTQHSNIADAVEQGLQVAEEIQKTKFPTRTCDHCGKIRPLSQVLFVAICAEGCINVKDD